jgi:periplasmic protein CpxP/Spy
MKAMSLQRKLIGSVLTLGLSMTFAAAAYAQQQPQDSGQQQEERWERRGERRRGMGKRGHGGVRRLFRELNLTEAQQQQLRAIEERYEASIRPQREEMRRLHESNQGELSEDVKARMQALRAEMRQAMTGLREEMLNVLTPEQRAHLEQLVKERKARRGEGRRMNPQDNNDDQ